MTNHEMTKAYYDRSPEDSRVSDIFARIADKIPTVIVFGLIALYYIQLSHMG